MNTKNIQYLDLLQEVALYALDFRNFFENVWGKHKQTF